MDKFMNWTWTIWTLHGLKSPPFDSSKCWHGFETLEIQLPLSKKLFLNSQKRLECKENATKYRCLFWKPRSHVRILIYSNLVYRGRSRQIDYASVKTIKLFGWELACTITWTYFLAHHSTKFPSIGALSLACIPLANKLEWFWCLPGPQTSRKQSQCTST